MIRISVLIFSFFNNIVQGAIESFAHELAGVLRRFLKLKSWKDAERLVFGGGFAGSHRGAADSELADAASRSR
jgi:hypothetical protein